MNKLNLKIESELFNLDVDFETEINEDIYEKFMKDYGYGFLLATLHNDRESRIKAAFTMIQSLLNNESILKDEAKKQITITKIKS